MTRLVECLCREMESAGSEWTSFDTVYFGGGTPSLLDSDHLKRLTHTIRTRFALQADSEITMEINPGDVSVEKLEHWLECGVNRFSLGVQSLDPDALRFLGRRHDRDQALAAVDRLHGLSGEQGETNRQRHGRAPVTYSVDLLMGIPGQDDRSYRDTLRKIIEYRPPHLSCYQLSVEPGTPLAADVVAGTVRGAMEHVEAAQFAWTHEYLNRNGYRHYEVSNYALGESAVSRHNLKYWFRARYLGIGPSAHSCNGGKRWWNTRNLADYCRRIDTRHSPVSGYEHIDSKTALIEKVFLGLRTRWGLDTEDTVTGEPFAREISRLVRTGFLVEKDLRLRPTMKGLAMADAVAERLVACL
jgi:oxygen-independent coproporphyrinogen III oxidase